MKGTRRYGVGSVRLSLRCFELLASHWFSFAASDGSRTEVSQTHVFHLLIDRHYFSHLLHQHYRVISWWIVESPCISRVGIDENNSIPIFAFDLHSLPTPKILAIRKARIFSEVTFTSTTRVLYSLLCPFPSPSSSNAVKDWSLIIPEMSLQQSLYYSNALGSETLRNPAKEEAPMKECIARDPFLKRGPTLIGLFRHKRPDALVFQDISM